MICIYGGSVKGSSHLPQRQRDMGTTWRWPVLQAGTKDMASSQAHEGLWGQQSVTSRGWDEPEVPSLILCFTNAQFWLLIHQQPKNCRNLKSYQFCWLRRSSRNAQGYKSKAWELKSHQRAGSPREVSFVPQKISKPQPLLPAGYHLLPLYPTSLLHLAANESRQFYSICVLFFPLTEHSGTG